MGLTPPRGTDDLVPPRSEALLTLQGSAHRVARLHGYWYVETPAFEDTEVFSRTSGESSDIVQKEMYTFKDKGGRWLTLRPEGTAPVVRAYLARAQELPSPFKAYYLESMWRYGRPQAGRLREFRQFGVEVLGTAGPAADVEVIVVGDRYLRAVGLSRFELEVNSIGDERCRPAYRRELIEYLEANRARLADEHRDRFPENPLRILDCKDPSCRAVSGGAPKISDRLCGPCREHFEVVLSGLEAEGLSYRHNPLLVRGLDYYTRTTFEYRSEVLSAGQSELGGGGRYDGLAEVLGGPPTPGVGFALGLERILLAVEREGVATRGPDRLEVFVVAMGEEATRVGRELARSLRDRGIPADASLEDRPLKAQMRMADRAGATFACIIGERELADGKVTVRRLADRHQELVSLEDVPRWISERA